MKSYKKLREYYQPKVLELASSGMSVKEIVSLFPLSAKTVYRWISIFADANPQPPLQMDKKKKTGPMPATDPSVQETDVEVLRARIRELESQLTMAEIKAEAYDEMINVAESKFNIQIRKKAGAKR
jgi:hypothetical protein